MMSRFTNVTATVARSNYAVSVITLYLSYGTFGSGYSGKIKLETPYADQSRFIPEVSWKQTYIHDQISSTGKDVFVTASGELVCSYFISGFLKSIRETVSISGNVTVIR